MPSIRSLRLKGNERFENGQIAEAADSFQAGVHAFLDAHSTEPDDVEEFVKVAGNWLVCLYQQSKRELCVSTARELLSTYPIIPKAYGVMGMCIVDELQRRQELEAAIEAQRDELSSETTSPHKASTSSAPATHATTTTAADMQTPTRGSQSDASRPASGIRLTHRTGSSNAVEEVVVYDGTAATTDQALPTSAAAGTTRPAAESRDASPSQVRGRTAEELRQDPHRYWVKLAGLVCTVDDAHSLLCRAVSMAPHLQRSLQPYLDFTVRLVSEQVFSAAPAMERALGVQRRVLHDGEDLADDRGTFVLDTTCPAEDGLYNVPTTPSTAPKLSITRVQMLNVDRPESAPVSISDSAPEAQAARKQYAEDQKKERDGPASPGQATNGELRLLPEQLRPVDFALSGAMVPVRVCHSERGGLPRSLTIVRAPVRPFALARWVQAVATSVSRDGTTELLVQPQLPHTGTAGRAPHHVDPLAAMLSAQGAGGSTVEVLSEGGSGASDISMGLVPGGVAGLQAAMAGMSGDATTSSCCVACAKELGSVAAAVVCPACGIATYCSTDCAQSYSARHEAYECGGLVVLQREIHAAAESALNAAEPDRGAESTVGASDAAGGAWAVPDLLHRVVPLTLAAYSGLCTRADGWEVVSRAVRRGVHRNVKALVPPTVLRVLDLINAQLPAPQDEAGEPASADLITLFALCRLYQTRHSDQEVSSLYAERLLLRHSCEPNCVWSSVTRTITTARFIAKGEELTMTVDPDFPQHWPHQVRTKWWLRQHGFVCQCARCSRESRLLNSARGDLSDDIIEQLLTADALRKPTSVPAALTTKTAGSAAATLLPTHPTHFFHPLVQKAILASRAGHQSSPQAVARLHELRQRCAEYLLPSHYLFEDLRLAECALAEAAGQADVSDTLGRASLLFLEALWPGAIPAKCHAMEVIPQVFNCRRRTVHNRRMRRQNKPKALDASQDGTATAAAKATAATSTAVSGPAAPGRARARLSIHADSVHTQRNDEGESEQSIVEKYMGSYRAWYL